MPASPAGHLLALLVVGAAACGRHAGPEPGASGIGPASSPDDVRVEVQGLRTDSDESPVVLLGPAGGASVLPIWIGPAEAWSIALALAEVEAPRPMTHDLVVDLLEASGVRLERVTVTELQGGTYLARMHLRGAGEEREVDSRPSDAIAIALRSKTPIFVRRSLLRSAGVPSAETGSSTTPIGAHGLHVQALTDDLAEAMGVEKGHGVVVARVAEHGPAERAGLRPGDVLTAAGERSVSSPDDLVRALAGSEAPVTLEVARGAERLHLVLPGSPPAGG